MREDIVIRAAEQKDLPGILRIYNEAVLNTTATYDYEPRTLEHRQLWFEDHLRINFPIYVAESTDGEILGWSSLSRYHDRQGFQFTAENSVYVATNYRGQGIGFSLLNPLIAGAKLLNLHAIIAAVDAENRVSIRLHERLGFKVVAHFPQVGFKFGRWLDMIYLQLLLPEVNPTNNEPIG